MLSQGVTTRLNFFIFKSNILGRLFKRYWRYRRGPLVEGINAEYAREIRRHVGVPVICTGGFQHASAIGQVIRQGWCDAVSIARPLIRNNDLPLILKKQNGPVPGKECTYCNKCLLNDLENPLGCYEVSRFPGDSWDEKYDNMILEVMSVFDLSLIHI